MRIAKDIRKILSEKWFMAGFGLAQEIELTSNIYIEFRVTDGLHGKTAVWVMERLKSGNEAVRYCFECFLASQAAYRLQHLQPRSWQLNEAYDGMTEYNLTEFRD